MRIERALKLLSTGNELYTLGRFQVASKGEINMRVINTAFYKVFVKYFDGNVELGSSDNCESLHPCTLQTFEAPANATHFKVEVRAQRFTGKKKRRKTPGMVINYNTKVHTMENGVALSAVQGVFEADAFEYEGRR